MPNWMIYGANGYTGKLTVAEAVARGMTPVVAGRNRESVTALAEQYGLEARVFSLDQDDVARQIADCRLVLHCAGPFSITSEPMMQACLKARAHYLDITGEIDVFARGHALRKAAQEAGIVVIPGTGFDVVPTDCMAAGLAHSMDDATHLILAFEAAGGPSPGTAKTSVEGLGKGGRVRRDGRVVTVPLAYKAMDVPFPNGNRMAMTIPWREVFTAYISTGIPNIETYMSVPPSTIKKLRRIRWMRPLFSLGPVQSFMKNRIDRQVKGPSEKRRGNTGCQVWGQVTNAAGEQRSGTLTTPNGYELTVTASLGIVARLLSDQPVEGGYYTPSKLMGRDYITTLPGTEMKLG